jgi:C4-dicarboxylate transporter, DctM subunit
MDPLSLGALIAFFTVIVLFSGVPVGAGLLIVATGFLFVFDGPRSLQALPELFYAELNSFALLSIPMFIIMGAAISSTRAGPDLYEALERWLTRVPGGLLVSNLGACALFAAMSGSSPATCAAIGKMGIPEMRKRGYCGWDLGYFDSAFGHDDCLWNCHGNIDRQTFLSGGFPGPIVGVIVHSMGYF